MVRHPVLGSVALPCNPPSEGYGGVYIPGDIPCDDIPPNVGYGICQLLFIHLWGNPSHGDSHNSSKGFSESLPIHQ